MKVLFVDDEDYGVKHFLTKLQDYHTVTKVSSYSAALKEIENPDFEFEVTILDVRIKPAYEETMSDLEYQKAGLRLYETLRRLHPKKRVIILTNNFDHVPVGELQNDDYVRAFDKSQIDPGDLLDAVRERP